MYRTRALDDNNTPPYKTMGRGLDFYADMKKYKCIQQSAHV